MSEIITIKITDDGLFGQAVNPFSIIYLHPDLDYQEEMNKKYSDFDTNNSPYPLTKQGEPRKVVEAVLVWQYRFDFETYSEWINIEFPPEVNKETVLDGYDDKRQAFEVISNEWFDLEKLGNEVDTMIEYETAESYNKTFAEINKEEMPETILGDMDEQNKDWANSFKEQPVAEQSISDAENILDNECTSVSAWSFNRKQATLRAMEKYANHSLNVKGLVSKDRVCEIIGNRIADINTNINEIYDEPLLLKLEWCKNELTDLLNQIKEL